MTSVPQVSKEGSAEPAHDQQWQGDLKRAKHDRVLRLVLPMIEVWRFGNQVQFLITGISAFVGYKLGSYTGAFLGIVAGLAIGLFARWVVIKVSKKILVR